MLQWKTSRLFSCRGVLQELQKEQMSSAFPQRTAVVLMDSLSVMAWYSEVFFSHFSSYPPTLLLLLLLIPFWISSDLPSVIIRYQHLVSAVASAHPQVPFHLTGISSDVCSGLCM